MCIYGLFGLFYFSQEKFNLFLNKTIHRAHEGVGEKESMHEFHGDKRMLVHTYEKHFLGWQKAFHRTRQR